MAEFIVYPILGLKTDVGEDDPSLFKKHGHGFACHCVDGEYFSNNRVRNAASRAFGYTEWGNSAVSSPSNCLGVFELYDGSNRKIWVAYDGDMYRYDGSRDPQEVADAGATAWASDATDFYSFIRYGDYMVFSDFGEHTPYASDHNDATLAKLVSADTEYRGRYLESFQRRILLAYITNGITTAPELSVVWTDANPTPTTSCTFGSGDPPSNHLYLPVDDEITGIKTIGRNSCVVCSSNSINSLDYYVDYTNPFGFTTIVADQGFENNGSLVVVNGVLYGFNKNYGFCAFDGSRNFPAGRRPISYDIEDVVSTIRSSTYAYIQGAPHPARREIVWVVALDGSTVPNYLLHYDYVTGNWTKSPIATRCVAPIVAATNVTWTKLTTELGYTTWESLGNLRWGDLVNESQDLAFSGTDGKLYYLGTEGANGSAIDGYRVEPVMDFGDPRRQDLLREIWFNIVQSGSYSIYVSHRSGNTVGECVDASWTSLSEVSCNNTANPVTRLATTNRFHQIKWGTDAANEQFVVNRIDFIYEPQGEY
jgi:hypothetical protein